MPIMKPFTQVVLVLIVACAVSAAHARQPAPQAPKSQPTTQATTQATTQITPEQQLRFDELIALIEGQNSPEVRQFGARELLRQNWPTTPQRLAAILSGSDAAARSAVGRALSDLPEHIDAGFIEPLTAMLADKTSEVRDAAAAALAADRSGAVVPKMRGVAMDPARPIGLRRTVVETLGTMISRDAVAVLVDVLDDPSGDVRRWSQRALENIE